MLDSIINVQVTRQTQGVTQAGFGTPLILGPNAAFAQTEVRAYTSLAGVLEDFLTSTEEYKMAAKIFAQSPRPRTLKIGKTSTAVAQVVTYTPNVATQAIQEYEVTINGEVYTFTSDADPTAAEVVTGLSALINGDAESKVTASGTNTLILTADSAGVAFTYEASANLAGVLTTANNGIAEDIQLAIDADNDWYFLLTTSKDASVVEPAAEVIETLKKIYLFLCDDSDVIINVSNDVASRLKALQYFRTAIVYSKTPADRLDAALVGRVAPTDPGSETWAFKSLSGVTPDSFTENQLNQLNTKNANFYSTVAGVNVTMNGKTCGGEYIDIIRFIDWVVARMQEGIFTDLIQSDKVPFTDGGIAVVEGRMRSVLEAGVRAGGIPSSEDYTVTVPKAKDVSSSDKAARRLTGVSFTFIASGAIHSVEITGTVTL